MIQKVLAFLFFLVLASSSLRTDFVSEQNDHPCHQETAIKSLSNNTIVALIPHNVDEFKSATQLLKFVYLLIAAITSIFFLFLYISRTEFLFDRSYSGQKREVLSSRSHPPTRLFF